MASQTREKDGEILLPQFQSSDLPSKRLLGKGLCGIAYETMLDGMRYARKDFVEVPEKIFLEEVSVLGRLRDHKNIVKTCGFTVDDRSCSLVLEYMDDDLVSFLQKRKESKRSQGSAAASRLINSSLDEFIEERRKNPVVPDTSSPPPLELQEALDVMLQIARGMEYLHNERIVHGDLKPRNVLVRYSDEGEASVKVADFGLVQTKRTSMFFASRAARRLDMAQWKAPEYLDSVFGPKLNEKSLEPDSDGDEDTASGLVDDDWQRKADVYSFALTCFQILTGQVPYPDLNWKQLVHGILFEGLRPKLPAAFQSKSLDDLLESCWGDPADRPDFTEICYTLVGIIIQQLAASDDDEKPLSVQLIPKQFQGTEGSIQVIQLQETGTRGTTGIDNRSLAKYSSDVEIVSGKGDGSRQNPPLIPTFQNPESTTPRNSMTAKSAANVPLLPKHNWDIEHGMRADGYHLGLTESDIERNEGIDIMDNEHDALHAYYEVKRLLWIKRNTVYSAALDECDRKVQLLSDRVDKTEKRSRELKNKIHQFIGGFFLLQGVLYYFAVAQSSNGQYKACKKVWSPVILTALLWAVTIVGIWQKLSRIQMIDYVCFVEDEARREAVRRSNALRDYGQGFKFREHFTLKEIKTHGNPYYGFGCHFWINRFGVIVVSALSVFTGIFIASHFLVLCNRGLAPIKP